MNNGTVITGIRDNIATINFYHPASNSFPTTLLNKLVENIERLGVDEKVKVMILKSEGEKAF